MYDTIHIRIDDLEEQGLSRDRLVEHLATHKVILNEDGTVNKVFGNYYDPSVTDRTSDKRLARQMSMTVNIKGNSATFTGSLSRAIKGSNVYTIDPDEMHDYFFGMSHSMGINMLQQRVTRADVAFNLEMTEPPVRYISMMGDAQGHETIEYPTYKMWKKGYRTMKVYSKLDAINKLGQYTGSNTEIGNLLRVETSVKHNALNNVLGTDKTIVYDLLSEWGISQLFADYKDATKNIPYLMENTELMLDGITNAKTFLKNWEAFMYKQNQDLFEKALELATELGYLGDNPRTRANYRNRAREKKKRMLNHYSTRNDYIDEVQSKLDELSLKGSR